MAVCTMRKSAIMRSVIRKKPEAMPAGFNSVVPHFLFTRALVARRGHDCQIHLSRFPGNLLDGFRHILYLSFRHRRIEGQGNQAGIEIQDVGATVLAQFGAGREERMQRNGNEMDTRPHAALFELFDELVASDRQTFEIEAAMCRGAMHAGNPACRPVTPHMGPVVVGINRDGWSTSTSPTCAIAACSSSARTARGSTPGPTKLD